MIHTMADAFGKDSCQAVLHRIANGASLEDKTLGIMISETMCYYDEALNNKDFQLGLWQVAIYIHSQLASDVLNCGQSLTA